MSYPAYLRSEHWQQMRQSIWARDGGKCQHCGRHGRDVHHLSYERVGREDEGDLILLCRGCHLWAHKRMWRWLWWKIREVISEIF